MILAALLLGLAALPPTCEPSCSATAATSSHGLASMLEALLESDGSGRRATIAMHLGSFLEDIDARMDVRRDVQRGKWNVVVLQDAKLSSSHKYNIRSTRIRLAKQARVGGAGPALAEWPRRGWNESGYILSVYRQIAQRQGAKIVPVCAGRGPSEEPAPRPLGRGRQPLAHRRLPRRLHLLLRDCPIYFGPRAPRQSADTAQRLRRRACRILDSRSL